MEGHGPDSPSASKWWVTGSHDNEVGVAMYHAIVDGAMPAPVRTRWAHWALREDREKALQWPHGSSPDWHGPASILRTAVALAPVGVVKALVDAGAPLIEPPLEERLKERRRHLGMGRDVLQPRDALGFAVHSWVKCAGPEDSSAMTWDDLKRLTEVMEVLVAGGAPLDRSDPANPFRSDQTPQGMWATAVRDFAPENPWNKRISEELFLPVCRALWGPDKQVAPPGWDTPDFPWSAIEGLGPLWVAWRTSMRLEKRLEAASAAPPRRRL